MTYDFKIVEEPKKPLSVHPKKFAMWLFIVSVSMLFAALTSAYIVRRAEGNWMYFELPTLFYTNTVIIVFSSIAMQWTYWLAKKGLPRFVKVAVFITLILGVAFLVGQFMAWKALVEHGVYLVGNPSGSFLYVLTGLHGVHIISALFFLGVVLLDAYRLKQPEKKLLRMEICVTYWHFLGGLWVYLLIFLLFVGS